MISFSPLNTKSGLIGVQSVHLVQSVGNTSSTQVDLVVVLNYGIFCIKTKTYKGWIFGSADQRTWTQVIYKFKKKFYNPLWQNFAHAKAIELLVKPISTKIPIVSLVAFPVADKLKISGTDRVANARNTVEKIKSFTASFITDLRSATGR